MRSRDLLHPAKVNGIVDVVLLVDIGRLNGDGDFEGVRWTFGFQDKISPARDAGVTIPA
jgi:hypothetical protein